ncbi:MULTISPECIES: 50S ribosomal protein L25/general stress protein Ctc [unclassified Rhodococcus (in: high G+C Gram-positive bacteria)]|jgi:large subunit ribosomal protein L25|uniref:50S ribosomal protein L25/general stress protein Ctc n=1 Tax=unclassified Rhodococcus (in: high G+C Gram-positive bacteria) TaxID=192944 RepID=UPI0006FF9FC8|nr:MULTISPECIES: 50S ribosomal protein L25/general stress protein Ctc [unclassified Rhodococcus (in: high G+C Gram-positive bacteria)]KQU39409.1 50S ribosomal protein L25 [Rhodococcus sp. Leaf225]KQU43845.1 50S ribosomal protein L25 [Rhodococcus sp. Leaf258]MBY6677609.1 50S ribosomal protein L25/general stress protein Ctc [Rhodococcus sp. BP-332]MBY6706873.1 50S ribosomal protein L25/general stress protein Ctc [Rhodococcus sp. BP-241]MDQ1181244.1 large subunit ribosomal protein L25 [Rhodococcu
MANVLNATVRTEFGKGAARRTRRDGLVPAVLYGHATEPKHLSLPSREFAAVLRADGTNAVIELQVDGEKHLALTKSVVVHPIRNYIEHADLLVIRRGEKVTVEINVVVTGDAAPGALVTTDANVIEIEVDATQIPEQFEVSVEDAEIGTQILASSIELPSGATLISDPELLLVNVVEAPSEAALEAEGAGDLASNVAAEEEEAVEDSSAADEAAAADEN